MKSFFFFMSTVTWHLWCCSLVNKNRVIWIIWDLGGPYRKTGRFAGFIYHHHHHHQDELMARNSQNLSVVVCPYHSLSLAGLLSYFPCPYRVGVNLCWSANIGTSICRSPKENTAHEFILASPTVHRMSCSSYLSGLWDVTQVASGICSRQHVAFLCCPI